MPAKSVSGIVCTHTGKVLDVLNPHIADIDIVDIAHALAYQCRYGGRCERYYSIAEHCVLMADYDFLPGRPLAKLLHDASEAYVGDVVRGIKVLLPVYQEIEQEFHRLIGIKYGVAPEEFATVKEADNIMLMSEARDIMSKSFSNFLECIDERPDERIMVKCYPPAVAEFFYMKKFNELTEN
jgi:uncharacterized protein